LAATLSLSEARKRNLKNTERIINRPNGWRVNINGNLMPGGTECQLISSEFGSIDFAIATDSEGNFLFDRPVFREPPAVVVVTWGYRGDDIYVGLIRQERPLADDPSVATGIWHKPLVFAQTPMGNLNAIVGEELEPADIGALRELAEEMSIKSTVLRVVDLGRQYMNPTTAASSDHLFIVQVDLEKVEQLRPDKKEGIVSAEYVPLGELLRSVVRGSDDRGAIYRMGISNGAWLAFLAWAAESGLLQIRRAKQADAAPEPG
jgi:NUDIX domain